AMENTIRIPRTIDINYFLDVSHTYLTKLKKADPEFGKTFKKAETYYSTKIQIYMKRLWKVRYNNFYADIKVNSDINLLPRVSPYDIDEALGVLSEAGEDGKSMLERATGFMRGEIKEIRIEEKASYGYGTDEIAIYEVIVSKTLTDERRFWLHLQKENAPSIINTFDNLVTLQDQSVYDKLYGMGRDSYTGRTGYATERKLYAPRARLIEKGYTESEIVQIELNLIKSIYAATMDVNGIGWIVTDPNAIGFIEINPGMYEAKISDFSKIAKGYSLAALAAFYTDLNGAWAGKGYTAASFSPSGDGENYDPYIYDGKEIYIDWINVPGGCEHIIVKALIDNNMLLDWIGKTELPAVSSMIIKYVFSGEYKSIFKIYFEDYPHFTFGLVHYSDIPVSVA
ncbi:MAG: hypothetical protein KAQ99_04330, partial [Candidatus Aureabacteria bacterium]|nr:hypothetical protein [Candidatus Auribacterota bacterium]